MIRRLPIGGHTWFAITVVHNITLLQMTVHTNVPIKTLLKLCFFVSVARPKYHGAGLFRYPDGNKKSPYITFIDLLTEQFDRRIKGTL